MISHKTASHRRKKSLFQGFTIIELMVSLVIIGILLAIIVPAIQQALEAARRTTCKNNLHQIGAAISDYDSQHGIFPHGASGTPDGETNFSFLVLILPQMEQEAIYKRLLRSKGFAARQWARETLVNAFVCPSDSETIQRAPRTMGANYAGNFGTGVQKFGYNGVFLPAAGSEQSRDGSVRSRDIKDGLSNTAMVSEILTSGGSNSRLRLLWRTEKFLGAPDQLEEFAAACALVGNGPRDPRSGGRGRPWINGFVNVNFYNHILTPNQPSCTNGGAGQEGAYTATSQHFGGVNVLYADGTVKFTSETINLEVWRAAGSRNGGEYD